MSKNKVHEFVIKVSFDKACNKKDALAGIRECVHGEYFTCGFSWQPEVMKVKKISKLPTANHRE